jgi:hypothetical protein
MSKHSPICKFRLESLPVMDKDEEERRIKINNENCYDFDCCIHVMYSGFKMPDNEECCDNCCKDCRKYRKSLYRRNYRRKPKLNNKF